MINCFRSKSGWYVGDVLNSMRVPEFCSIAKVDATEHRNDLLDGIISGGMQYGAVLSNVMGY